MVARFYRNTDAGAPVLDIPSSTYTVDSRRFGCLKQILKAVLVDGYGSGAGAKPAAGWTLIQEQERTITLRNASGKYVTFSSFFLFMSPTDYRGDQYYRIYLHNTYTGIVNGVPQGEGVVSGVATNSSTPHYWGGQYLFMHANTQMWTMLADDRTFFIQTHGNPYGDFTISYVVDQHLAENQWNSCLYVGDDSEGTFIATGGTLTTSLSDIPNQYFTHDAMTTLTNPNTGLLIDTGGAPATTQVVSLFAVGNSSGPTVFSKDKINMAPVEWVCGSKFVGCLRGAFLDVCSGHSRGDILYRALISNVTPVRPTHTMAPALMADGHSYLIPFSDTKVGRRCVFTDNPALW